MPIPFLILPIALGGLVIISAGMIGFTIFSNIKEAIERGKTEAPGMPQPPPGFKKKHMKNAAKKLGLKYEYYNFGFCGPRGSGKSSLINSLRNFRNTKKTEDWKHDILNAAPTGETETTTELNQYGWREGDNEVKYVRLWDIPGCGTINNQIETYFKDNYLYAFDCLLMVTSGILGEYELQIISDAGACKRPVVVVLSQSELKAEAKARDQYDTTALSTEEYQSIVEDTINEAKENMRTTLVNAKTIYKSLDVSRVFVVSAVKYRDFLKNRNETDELLSFETSELLVYLLKEAKDKRVL